MLRAGLIVVLLAGASCSVANPFFAVDADDPGETEGSGSTATTGVVSEPTSDPGSATDVPGTSTSTTTQASETTTVEPDPVCGDGVREGPEPCDDGNDEQNDGCLNGCKLPSCGDGFVQAGHETCDDGDDDDDDACTNDCTSASCGNGQVDGGGEQCDDGNLVDTDDCTGKCLHPICGDGILHEGKGEVCDDGNLVDTDECAACRPAVCGDGFVHAGIEECDDGNGSDEDECPTTCVAPYCGDGFVQAGEMCDAGPNNPQLCPDCSPPAVCGDGIISGKEQCDPHAPPYDTIGVPLCNDICKLTACAGFTNTPEKEFNEKPNTWLNLCAWALSKSVVVVTLLDDANQVVYMAKGTMIGEWTPSNLTSGDIAHSSEYDVNLHKRQVVLTRFMPDDGETDVLMVAGASAVPGNAQVCYSRLGDGYGLAVYPNTLPDPLQAQNPKMLVMGMNGASGMQRFAYLDGAREISYDEAGMDVCVDSKPFSGSFLLSLFGQ